MLGWKSRSWFYPKPTGDPGRDRNARTVQFACFLLAFAVSTLAILNVISGEPSAETPILGFAAAGLVAAMVTNRAGNWEWAARTAFLAVLLAAMLLVFEARDGFRSLSMLLFPGMLLFSVMLLDRASYMITAGIVLLAATGLGIAERRGLTRAIPHVRSSTTYESIFFVDLNLLVFAMIGSRIVSDAKSNVFDLCATIDRVSKANLTLEETAEALRKSEQQLVSIYNTVWDVIFHLAVEAEGRFRFVSVNAAFLRVTGLSREAVIGKTVSEVIPEPSLTMVLEKYRQAIEEKTTVVWEETSDYPTGRLTGEVSVAPVFDDKGICTHLVGSVYDMTERKRAEAALRESELRYREVFHSFSECIFVLDVTPDGRFRIAGFNPAEERATGLSNAEVAGKFIDNVLPEDTAQRAISHYRRCLEVGTIIHYDEELNLPIGARYFHTNLIPLRDEIGRIHRIIGCCLDYTDLKRSQEEASARQKLESVGTLASGIAHDFNNLLGGVLAQADLALAEHASGASPTAPLKTIQDLAIRGSEIVRQLMIYAGNESEVLELVNVSWVVEGMLGLLKVSLTKHAVLETDLGEGLRPIRCRAAQLRQIVMNLVTNASEAIGDRDGVIRLKTGPATAGGAADIFKGMTEGDYVELAVSDTGAGMPEQIQARVFDPFFTTKSAGRGLGLWVVHGIVRSLGGAIQIASEPGKGTRVHITLPGAEGTAGVTIDQASGADEVVRPSQKFTVLVVEDEDSLRQAVVKMLRREGFEVFDASSGSAAIDLLRADSGKIDLMLLDMTIPGATFGDVVTEAARVRPDIKVIATSAYSQEMLADKLGAPQICAFIRKPFRLPDLVKRLQDACL
jgi:PAS domain S-box-containing protein